MYIDEALLVAAQGEVGRALEILEVSGSGWHDVSVDVALQLLGEQSRLLLDGALLARSWEQGLSWGSDEARETVEAYAAYRADRIGGEDVTEVMLELAGESLAALSRGAVRKVGKQHWEFVPFMIWGAVLEAWRLLLASERPGEVQLLSARQLLNEQLERMAQSGCRLHELEARRLIEAIDDALAALPGPLS